MVVGRKNYYIFVFLLKVEFEIERLALVLKLILYMLHTLLSLEKVVLFSDSFISIRFLWFFTLSVRHL